MIPLDLTDDLGAHEVTPYCDGHAVDLAPLKLHRFLKRHINGLFSLKEGAEFPGSRPSVLSHADFASITEIHQSFLSETKGKIPPPFLATEKTDGKRMYLFFCCTSDYTRKFQVAIDTKYNMRLVYFDVPNEFYEGTVLDGELVEDVTTKESIPESKYIFYVFDCLECMGTPIRKQWFSDRLFTASKLVPMIHLLPSSSAVRSAFEVKMKHFYPLEKIVDLLNTRQVHPSDGLIINRNEAASSCFHCPNTHKWKSLRDSTMDFLMLFLSETNVCCFHTKKQKKPCFRQALDATMRNCSQTELVKTSWTKKDRLCHPVISAPRDHLHFQIVECFYCPHEKLWKPKKLRRDKEFPNSLHVLQETIKVMKKPIYLAEIVQAWNSNNPGMSWKKEKLFKNEQPSLC